MITFMLGILTLLSGYFFYSRFIEKNFGIEHKRPTPAFELADGNDFVILGTKKERTHSIIEYCRNWPDFWPNHGSFIWTRRLHLDYFREYLCRSGSRFHAGYDFSA